MRRIRVPELIESLPILASRLREAGLRVGTSQLVEAARILEAYSSLRGLEYLDVSEAVFVLSGALSVGRAEESVIADELQGILSDKGSGERARRILAEIEERLGTLKIKPGQPVVKRAVIGKGRGRRERIAAYLDLKSVGVIRGKPGAERVASWEDIVVTAKRLARRGYDSLREAVADRASGWSEDDLLLRAEAGGLDEDLGSLDSRRLLKLGEAALRKGDKRTLAGVAEEVSRRILAGAKLDAEAARRILSKAGLLSPSHLRVLATQDVGSIRPSDVSPEEAAKLLMSLPEEKAAEALAKLLRRSRDSEWAEKLVSQVDPLILWSVGRHPLRGEKAALLDAAVMASRSLREALLYAETGEPGRADMALYLAERSIEKVRGLEQVQLGRVTPSSIESMAKTAESIVEALNAVGEDPRGLTKLLAGMPITRALIVLRGLYGKAQGEARRIIAQAAAVLLYRFASREGLRLLPRKLKTTTGPGRLDVKDTVLRLSRIHQDPLVYRRKLKSRRVSLALDVSGSMLEYSVWALAIAMLFSNSVEKLTLFSHEIRRVEGPLSKLELAEVLLGMRFQGYTDIYNALQEACDATTRRVVVISDLKQTVASGDPAEVVSEYRRRGYKMLFITPPDYDPIMRESLELAGARVAIAYKPQDAAREVLRYMMR